MGVLVNGQMDWARFRKVMPNMRPALVAARLDALNSGKALFVVEHSGAGKWMLNTLNREIIPDVRIHLMLKSEKEMKAAAEKRGLSYSYVLKWNQKIRSSGVSQANAINTMTTLLDMA